MNGLCAALFLKNGWRHETSRDSTNGLFVPLFKAQENDS